MFDFVQQINEFLSLISLLESNHYSSLTIIIHICVFYSRIF